MYTLSLLVHEIKVYADLLFQIPIGYAGEKGMAKILLNRDLLIVGHFKPRNKFYYSTHRGTLLLSRAILAFANVAMYLRELDKYIYSFKVEHDSRVGLM